MAKIRKYYCKKKKHSGIEEKNMYALSSYRFSPVLFFHNIVPLRYKFIKEYFQAVEGNCLLGSIAVRFLKGVPYKVIIDELFFIEENYDVVKQLLEFIISYYGAKGAVSFGIKVSDVYSELLNLLVTQYNFRQCSYERLWKVSRRKYEEYEYSLNVRTFRNSDASSVAVMYNESLISHFRTSLSLAAKSFNETIFPGISPCVEYKYIIEDAVSSNILAYISISSCDNENYILDIVQTSWYEAPINDIIAFACAEIKKRNLNFVLFVKSKKYTLSGAGYEEFFMKNKFLLSQTDILLIKDYYKTVSIKNEKNKFIMLGQPSY